MAKLYPNCKIIFKSGLRVTQDYGVNADYYKQFGLLAHEGLDATPIDSTDKTIHSLPYKGKVVKDIDMGDKGGAYGINNTIWYPEIGEAWQYCHMEKNFLSMDQEVAAGAEIGIMGVTGNTSGLHVHINRFKVDSNGYRLNKDNGYLGGIDPLPFLLGLDSTNMNMYTMKSGNQVDLSNFESNKVLADIYDEVIHQKIWVKVSEVNAKIEEAVKARTATLEQDKTNLQKQLDERPVIEKPVEVIKEVPVEVIKEVPKEVIKEVIVEKPVPTPSEQLGAKVLISLALQAIIERRW